MFAQLIQGFVAACGLADRRDAGLSLQELLVASPHYGMIVSN
jgi:hypothetical protein